MKAKLRILSYNIHKGFTATNSSFVLGRIKESIRIVHADVVFLQEVLGHHEDARRHIKDWPTPAQFEYLADQVWRHHAYGQNAVYTSGHHGNAILSKYPILRWENVDISTNRLERRGLLHAVIQYPRKGTEVHAVCLHLGLFESGRRKQIQSLARRIDAMVPTDAPLIVAGDFNDWAETSSGVLEDRLGLKEAHLMVHKEHARTFPSWMPMLRLDRIYIRNLVALDAQNLTGHPWNELSDHTALMAEIGLPGV